MKKYMVWIFIFLFFLPTPCCGSESHYRLRLNAKLQATKHPLLEREGQVHLALEDGLILLEGDYTIHPNTQDRSVTVVTEGGYSYFAEGHLFGMIQNKLVQLPSSPFFEEGVLYLPASACAKLTGSYLIKSKSYLQFFKWKQ